jgi:DNA-binding NtrC family response regulator/pSer/pThr/pTyr-binding forkhead associated (FHA) protein
MSSDRTTAAAAVIVDSDDQGQSDRAFLVVYYGQGNDSRGRVVPLPDGVAVTFGRLPANDVAIDHELVSRRHARVVRYGADIVVEDQGSRNGTRVNGSLTDGPTHVSPGDEILIGPATAIVGVTSAMRRRTSVGSASELEERLESELDRAIRYRRPLGLAMVRFDGSSTASGAALEGLRGNLRRMDYLAQYGPEEYAIVLPEADQGATQAAGYRLVVEARDAGRRAGELDVYVGVAVCPENGTKVGELVSSARAALRSARVGGGTNNVASAPGEEAPRGRNIVVADPVMKRVYALARKVASTPITVLVLGETGAGKEIVASAIHLHSSRVAKPFVALNCSALPETLLESELFGHERGAFTGAERRKQGYFEAADGGTIFLDEIGEMPMGVQAKLLRVLEQRVVTRVGGTQPISVDVRVVCATNRDLEREIERGRFRGDLYFRLSPFTLVVPPLRDRRSEIEPLALHFARQFAAELGQSAPGISAEALELLESYDWPGNVRELRNAIERAVVLRPGDVVLPEHLPDRVSEAVATAGPRVGSVKQRVARVERQAVLDALEACDNNQTRAAKRLGISRFALIRLMQKYGLKRPRSRRRKSNGRG